MSSRFYVVSTADKLRWVAAQISNLPVSYQHQLEIIVRDLKREKSAGQRNLFHALCSEFGSRLGMTPGAVKDFVKADFYGTESVHIGDRVVTVIRSSEDSDREEYGRLIDHVIQVAAEQGIHLSKGG